MSNIKSTLYRSNDHRILKVNVSLDFNKSYEFATISFKCGESKIDANTTSTGSIDQEGNVKINSKKCEIDLDYCENSNILECLVGYYAQNDLIHYETLTTSFDNTKLINKTHISIPELRTISGSHTNRMKDFFELLDRRKSSWEIKITYPSDLHVEIVKKGTIPIMVSFGEKSKDIRVSDYIFKLDTETKNINIPRELIKQHHPNYSVGADLGIFELIKPDFLAVSNIYYKVLISNTLSLSSFTK